MHNSNWETRKGIDIYLASFSAHGWACRPCWVKLTERFYPYLDNSTSRAAFPGLFSVHEEPSPGLPQ